MDQNNIDLTASGMPMYGNMMTPWQQMQMMYQNQSKFLMEQQKMLMQEQGVVVLKMFFVNEGENRRVKMPEETDFKKLFDYIHHYIQPYHTLKGARINKLQYEDEDKEWMNFNTEKEWKDCKRICAKLKKTNVVKIKVYTDQKVKVKKEAPKIPEPKPVEEIPKPRPRTPPEVVAMNQPPKPITNYPPSMPPPPQEQSLEVKYRRQLQALKSMGFYNLKECLAALEKHNGNVDVVVKEFMKV